MTRYVVSSDDVHRASSEGRLHVTSDAVVTPLALDVARDLHVEIVRDEPTAADAPVAGAGDLTSLVRRMIRSLLDQDEAAAPAGSGRRVAGRADDRDVVAEPLPAADLKPGTRGGYGEVIASGGSSGLRAGYLTLCAGSLTRTMDTDQLLVVIEGELGLTSGAVTVRARAGELLFIPASSPARLEAATWAKAVCITVDSRGAA